MIILYICIGLILGCCGLYLILRPKLKITEQKNLAIQKENQDLITQNDNLKILQQTYESDIKGLNSQKEELKNSLSDLKDTQTQAAKDYYSQALEIAQNSFESEVENISDKLTLCRDEAQEEYRKTLQELVQDFQKQIAASQQKLNELTAQLKDRQIDVDLAVEAAQRQLEMETQQDYYRICLSNDDIVEINKLREVLPFLRDKLPLNKVIYKVYYERPLTDMIGRVVGPGVHTGIYKITNINNEMCYVGQAVNIADRWKQHVKRGVGAEDWTQNKLYPAMYSIGVENFTFEVLEECDRDKLNEREDYWQEYFHAKDFGYSIK